MRRFALPLLLLLPLAGCSATGTVPGEVQAVVTSPTSSVNGVLPDRQRTPGATNPEVTQDTIHSTICVKGWTAKVRPPESFTENLKRNQLANGYAYQGDVSLSDYEEDHLIPLELGGAPSDEKNLWPQPHGGGSTGKDRLENRLNGLVCSGQIPLTEAQQAIATDWWSAYIKYVR